MLRVYLYIWKGDGGSTTKIIPLSKLIGRHNGASAWRTSVAEVVSRWKMFALYSRDSERKIQIFSKSTLVTLELLSSFLTSHRFLMVDFGKKKEIMTNLDEWNFIKIKFQNGIEDIMLIKFPL